MFISAELRRSARAAYRALYRASSFTFAGDEPVLKAFRSKMREDALAAKAETDPIAYQQHTKHARDIATFLRRNIVRATKVEAADTDNSQATWTLHLHDQTELGDNESIKNSPKMESSRTSRRRERDASTSELAAQPVSDSSARPIYFSALKKAHRNRTVPELDEADVEEVFVRGSGPGGQSVNKTENNVQLLHKPTGIRVSCQESRSLSLNRQLARRLLLEKLDQLWNPSLSKEGFKRARQRERERRRRKKAKKKAMTNRKIQRQ
ncbi:hypothetical protein E1B28_008757 [Marasmius oreades]|uniref:Prokaryotic-type class I peptide chain release factors domain-containing protein n=1 Tax=Marasmius oreades TaxID=181124 RepID=A0A9P7RZ69_9AGAR|nr:uncharacterized protein E1B28_008757 [Marasmius oreades]KAG7092400.1 hypothetical protein E1B28_008757 [Marasmius oreades]